MKITARHLKSFCAKKSDPDCFVGPDWRCLRWHRYIGTFASDGRTIVCSREISRPNGALEYDKALNEVVAIILAVYDNAKPFRRWTKKVGKPVAMEIPSGIVRVLVPILGRHFQKKFIEKILTLPNVRFLGSPAKFDGASKTGLAFRFDGGCGMVMPHRYEP